MIFELGRSTDNFSVPDQPFVILCGLLLLVRPGVLYDLFAQEE